MINKKTVRKTLGLASVGFLVSGCASVPNPSPEDPLESYNRSMFEFNEVVDKALLKPVATGYRAVMPSPVRTCVRNVFGNLGDVWSAINSMLQGRALDSINTFGRVLFNSTMGIGGCIDVATMNGAHKIPNDFGTTLGVWGVGNGPYVVLPFFGPSTVRDSIGLVGDVAGGTAVYASPAAIDDVSVRNAIMALKVIDTRTNLLDADALAEDVALDKYTFVRDAYQQNRKALLESKLRPEVQDVAADDMAVPVYDDPEQAGHDASVPQYEDPGE
ncbi:MlaA family lipoprotein [Advenella alkanexedens]|uniref:MlaA family lipoprotein n=1 Tax=Advenella alkanexedens TaxID=1481665 RepID=UPI0026772EBD|nr:VacJ family lipoprotein [Advenella alkanexedens]WKU19420.1 VacJ family lipoprotein [Advenella alkanexedens]